MSCIENNCTVNINYDPTMLLSEFTIGMDRQGVKNYKMHRVKLSVFKPV
jgi:hypothetical protein